MTSGLFPGLSSPGKCHNKIPRLSRFSRTRMNPVHMVKAALAAEQAFLPGPALPSQPVQGASLIMNSSTVSTFGGVPSLLSSQANAFAASGSGFSTPSTSAGAPAVQGRPAVVVPTFVSTFLPPTPSIHCPLPTRRPCCPRIAFRPLSHRLR